MDVRNCKKCGKLFNFTGTVMPGMCKRVGIEVFDVRTYIYDNPKASMSTVAEEMDVPIQQIKKWVLSGKTGIHKRFRYFN